MPVEYYIARTLELPRKQQKPHINKEAFTVTKFDGSEVPEAVYLVVWDKSTDRMLCECPNKRRSAHVDDKHGQLVREWLAAGEPIGPMSMQPRARPSPYSTSTDDDIPF